MKRWTIAFDLNGNDNGIKNGIFAILKFVKSHFNYHFILIGEKDKILNYVQESENIKILDAPPINVNNNGKNILKLLKDKKNSMYQAINMVKTNNADVVISSGDTGVYFSLVTLMLKKTKNVQRPALMSIFPTIDVNKKFLMLDIGANLETKSEMMVQWAEIGSDFYQRFFKKTQPKVGILNIGTEKHKGFDYLHKEVDQKIRQKSKLNYEYLGFIESRKLLFGVADVVICDGYAGNMVLKSMEGSILSLFKIIKDSINKKIKYKIGGLFLKKMFSEIKENFDYRNVGMAWIVGVEGLAIKTHGSSDKQAYLGALNQIHHFFSKK